MGFTFEQLLRPVIPLLVIERGGDAALVGVVAGLHSLPSIIFRPLIGQAANYYASPLLRISAAVAALTPAGLVLPGLYALLPVRFLQGTAWAAYSVATHTMLAQAAPHDRRGEASGYFQATAALATLVGPGVGVALYIAFREAAPAAAASALALGGLVLAHILRRHQEASPHGAGSQPSFRWDDLVEPSALPATFIIATFMAAHALFVVFAPVYVLALKAPVEVLAIYYPIYGASLMVSQLATGRASDLIGRKATIGIGCGVGVVGVAIAAVGNGVGSLFTGAVTYSVAASLVSPATSALTIDRAIPSRLGSAMATYSIGYQLATGVSSLVFGAVIATAGFNWAFLIAMALQLVAMGISVSLARR